MGNSPRPGLWTLEKSSDYGKSWSAWQHFSDSPSDCEIYFGKDSLKPIRSDNDVICTTEFSKIVPLESGEVSDESELKLTSTMKSDYFRLLFDFSLVVHLLTTTSTPQLYKNGLVQPMSEFVY